MDILFLIFAIAYTLLFLGRLIGTVKTNIKMPDVVGIFLFFATILLWVLFYTIIK